MGLCNFNACNPLTLSARLTHAFIAAFLSSLSDWLVITWRHVTDHVVPRDRISANLTAALSGDWPKKSQVSIGALHWVLIHSAQLSGKLPSGLLSGLLSLSELLNELPSGLLNLNELLTELLSLSGLLNLNGLLYLSWIINCSGLLNLNELLSGLLNLNRILNLSGLSMS